MFTVMINVACSVDRYEWEGVWHSKAEFVPGLPLAVEFELEKNLFSDQWSGRWQVPELMVSVEIPSIKITSNEIKMDFGPDGQFKAELNESSTLLEGIMYDSEKNDSSEVAFIKVSEWISEKPARVDKNGKQVKDWNYAIPKLIDDNWRVKSLKDTHASRQSLDKLFNSVLDGEYKWLDAVLIAHKGQLVLEEYFHLGDRNRKHTLQSSTKSVTSLLVGMAHDDSLISDLNSPIKHFFPNYPDSLNTNTWPVSIKHALTMSAGIEWEETIPYTDPNNDVFGMNNSDDMYRFVLSHPMATGEKPGEKFEYNSGLSVLLGGVILNSTGVPIDKYAEQTLFKRLGIKQYTWLSTSDQVHTGGGLFLLPRDFLKIGQLILNNGKWNGQSVITESWIKESTAFQLPTQESSRDWGYGYQWWRGMFDIDQIKYPTIHASGHGGQFLWVIPKLDLVVVALHHNPSDSDPSHTIAFEEMSKYIIPAFIAN